MIDEFIHDEESLAIRFGVDRSVIRESRGTRGVGFIRAEHGRYLWTERAVAALAAQLNVTVPTEKCVRVLHVASQALPLPMQLACVEDDTRRHVRSEWIIVRVMPAMRPRFLPGMRITAEKLADNSWRYIGPENCAATQPVYPRSRGRW